MHNGLFGETCSVANSFHVQAERLAEFYELCTRLDVGRGERYATVEQVAILFVLVSI